MVDIRVRYSLFLFSLLHGMELVLVVQRLTPKRRLCFSFELISRTLLLLHLRRAFFGDIQFRLQFSLRGEVLLLQLQKLSSIQNSSIFIVLGGS